VYVEELADGVYRHANPERSSSDPRSGAYGPGGCIDVPRAGGPYQSTDAYPWAWFEERMLWATLLGAPQVSADHAQVPLRRRLPRDMSRGLTDLMTMSDGVDPREEEDELVNWMTVSDLLRVDWDRPVRRRDCMRYHRSGAVPGFRDWIAMGRPPLRDSCLAPRGSGSGGSTITQAIAELAAAGHEAAPSDDAIVTVSWLEPLRRLCWDFIALVDQYVLPIGDPRTTRVVVTL